VFKFEVGALRGCILGQAELTRLTLIAGNNHVGKTSFLQGIAAAVTGDTLIFPKLTKKDAKDLIHSDHNMGMATVTGPTGSITVSYPTLIAESKDIPPCASRIAMGLDSPLTMGDKERYAFLTKLLKSSPSREQFEAAVKDAGYTPESLTAIWKQIETFGWDATHKNAVTKGTEQKGAWQHVTGEQKWGSQKGETWMPAAWSADLISAKLEDLEHARDQAAEWVEAATRQEAVNTADRERLEAIVLGEGEHRTWYKAASEKLQKTKSLLTDACKERDKYRPLPAQDEPLACTECGAALIYNGKTLVKYDAMGASNAASAALKAKTAHESVLAIITQLEADKEREQKDCEQVAAKLRDIEAAKKELATMTAAESAKKTEIGLEDARKRLELAETRLNAWTAKTEADRLHRQILKNAIVVNALAPDGVRQTVLQGAIAAANDELAALSSLATWPAVSITPDIDLLYGGRRVFLLSDSEQLRARILLQLWVARRESAPFVIIDRADMLVTKAERMRLFKLVHRSGIPAVIAMSLHNRDSVPEELFKAPGCRAYWMNEGTMEAV
jgi:hypothetical protein